MKQKQYVVISAPVETYSGYGARARDFVKATIEAKSEDWDVWLLSQRWGNTPWGYLDENPEWEWMKKHLIPNNQLTQKPDVWMQITIPNEFQPIGNYNIGVTAGIETTLSNHTWIEGLNRMDLNLVSSNHSKQAFESTRAEEKDQNGNILRKIELQKPLKVVFEGADLKTYFAMEDSEIPSTDLVDSLDEIPENFNFLFVGHWLQGELGEDRKNVGMLIKTFLETFKNKHPQNRPGLILKTSGAGGSIMDRTDLLNKIDNIRKTVKGELPNIYLLHGELEEVEMNYLYNHKKVKAMVNLTKGEGFGRPLLEFSLVKKPIIVSGWSGHMDFINPEFTPVIGGRITQVHPSAANDWIIKESGWFTADYTMFANTMENVFSNYKKYIENAKRQSHHSRTNFSFENMVNLLKSIYTDNVKESPKLVLPKLPELPKLTKVK